MNSTGTILKREFFERVRQRSFLLSTVLVPVFMLGVTFVPIWLAARSTGRPMKMLAVDRTGTLGATLESVMPDTMSDGSRRFSFEWRSPENADDAKAREEFQQRALTGDYTGLLWIPADVLDGGTAEVFARGASDMEMLGRFRDALSRAAMMSRLEQRGISIAETKAISRAVPFKLFKLTEEGVREGGIESDFITSYVFAMIIYMTVLLYGMAVQRSVLEDKTSRIVEILLSTTKPFQLMLGKILGVGGVGLTQYAVWAAVALGGAAYIRATTPALAGVTALAPLTVGFFVVYFVLGFLLYAAIYAAVGAMVTTDQEAQQMQWPVTMLIVLPIILMMQVIRDPDGTMSTICSMIPFFSPIIMLVRINLHTPPMWQILLSVGILILSILALAALAGRIFRVGILMYGKRATLPEIIRWVRQS
jgi:ABC-2 type transport system permease protein